jgi:7,8-dihydropterin-6-yl-methyl-4-(beta-D-ribofuranosyl)aminobenzene 5'-phosphate synthase
MKITILCNNSVKTFSKCIGEHGFSTHIEIGKDSFLFDTGSGIGIIENSIILKKDIRSIKYLILSHGHRDHCGGLEKVLQYKGTATPVLAHSEIFTEKYSSLNKKLFFAGIPYRREYLETLGAKFRFIRDFSEISNNVYMSGEIRRANSFELPEKALLIKNNKNEYETDPLLDDNSMVIKTKKGLVLILGCAHAGLVNIMDYVSSKMNINRFYAVIGGTHLKEANEERISKTIETLKRYNVSKIMTCHCTGLEKESILKEKFGKKFFFAEVGTEFNI